MIGISARANALATANETSGRGMMKLTANSRTLLLGEGGAGVILKDQTFGVHGTGKVEIDGEPLIDIGAVAGATWPRVLGGPEGKYEAGMDWPTFPLECVFNC